MNTIKRKIFKALAINENPNRFGYDSEETNAYSRFQEFSLEVQKDVLLTFVVLSTFYDEYYDLSVLKDFLCDHTPYTVDDVIEHLESGPIHEMISYMTADFERSGLEPDNKRVVSRAKALFRFIGKHKSKLEASRFYRMLLEYKGITDIPEISFSDMEAYETSVKKLFHAIGRQTSDPYDPMDGAYIGFAYVEQSIQDHHGKPDETYYLALLRIYLYEFKHGLASSYVDSIDHLDLLIRTLRRLPELKEEHPEITTNLLDCFNTFFVSNGIDKNEIKYYNAFGYETYSKEYERVLVACQNYMLDISCAFDCEEDLFNIYHWIEDVMDDHFMIEWIYRIRGSIRERFFFDRYVEFFEKRMHAHRYHMNMLKEDVDSERKRSISAESEKTLNALVSFFSKGHPLFHDEFEVVLGLIREYQTNLCEHEPQESNVLPFGWLAEQYIEHALNIDYPKTITPEKHALYRQLAKERDQG